jgi:hypothetical protein
MIIENEEIKELTAEVPERHQHLRITLVLRDGREFTYQEATIAGLVRAYISVKTPPVRTGVRLAGKRLSQRKGGYAEWQLLEKARDPSRPMHLLPQS